MQSAHTRMIDTVMQIAKIKDFFFQIYPSVAGNFGEFYLAEFGVNLQQKPIGFLLSLTYVHYRRKITDRDSARLNLGSLWIFLLFHPPTHTGPLLPKLQAYSKKNLSAPENDFILNGQGFWYS